MLFVSLDAGVAPCFVLDDLCDFDVSSVDGSEASAQGTVTHTHTHERYHCRQWKAP